MRYGNPSKKTKTIASLRGHAIEFPGKGSVTQDEAPKGALVAEGIVYVHVPVAVQGEVAQQGMLPESEIEEVDEKPGPVKPEDSAKLQEAAFGAFDALINAGDRESFGGNANPKPAAVQKVLGYALTTNEVKDLWAKYRIEKGL